MAPQSNNDSYQVIEPTLGSVLYKLVKLTFPVVLLSAALAYFFAGNTPPEFVADAEEKAFSLLMTLLLIALFVERAVEVYVGALRSSGAAAHDTSVSSTLAEVEQIKKDIAGEKARPNGPNPQILHELEDRLDFARIAADTAVERRDKFGAETRESSLMAAVILGVIVAAVGPRIFVEMTNPMDELDTYQKVFQSAVDILITGGLIGGGSDGIHKLISVGTDKLDQIRNSTKKQ